MPRRVQGSNGVIQEFPDGTTDAEIAAALEDANAPGVSSQQAPAQSSRWSDRMGLNEPTASVVKGFARGSGAAAVDMVQGGAATILGRLRDAQREQHASIKAIQPHAPIPITDDNVPEQPDSFAGTVGSMLPTVAEMAIGGGAAAKGGVGVAKAVLPSTARAGKNFEAVMAAAGDMPVSIVGPANVALRIEELAKRGASLPKPVRNFMQRVMEPGGGPVVYREARDFASVLSRLSSKEYQKLSPVVAREVATMSKELNKAIATTAKQAGKLDEYQSAMKEYARAAKLGKVFEKVAEGAKKGAVPLAGAGALGWWGGNKLRALFGGME